MEKEKEKNCSSTGGWGSNKPSKSKSGFKMPAIWPGVYVWLLVGVFLLISQFMR